MIAFSWRCISLGNLYIERHSINHFVEQYKTIFPHCWWNLLANTDIQIEANMKAGNQRERQILKSASASANTVVVRCCELFQSCLSCLATVQNNYMGNSAVLNTIEYQKFAVKAWHIYILIGCSNSVKCNTSINITGFSIGAIFIKIFGVEESGRISGSHLSGAMCVSGPTLKSAALHHDLLSVSHCCTLHYADSGAIIFMARGSKVSLILQGLYM